MGGGGVPPPGMGSLLLLRRSVPYLVKKKRTRIETRESLQPKGVGAGLQGKMAFSGTNNGPFLAFLAQRSSGSFWGFFFPRPAKVRFTGGGSQRLDCIIKGYSNLNIIQRIPFSKPWTPCLPPSPGPWAEPPRHGLQITFFRYAYLLTPEA